MGKSRNEAWEHVCMTNEYYEKITRLLIIELRGKNTQLQMSEKLGFKYNMWAKWESGQKRLMWSEFTVILKVLKINIDFALSEILSKKITTKIPENELLQEILNKFGGFQDPNIFKKLQISKSSLYRQLTNTQNISLAFIFHTLDFLSATFPRLLKAILNNPSTPELKKLCSSLDSRYEIEGQYPWISAVEGILDTEDYKKLSKHTDLFIAKKLNISNERVKFALKTLKSVDAIEFKDNKYILLSNNVNFTDLVTSAKFMKFWTQVALNRFNTPDGVPLPRKGWSMRVYPVSKEAKQKIIKARSKFESELMKIISDDESAHKNQLQVLILHLFDDEEIRDAKLLQ